MTDAEIIKALEFCGKCECNDEKTQQECALINMSFCRNYLRKQAIDLINRQMAEIERLNGLLAEWKTEAYKLSDSIEEIKAESIKEFAERLKKAKQYSLERHENIVPVAVVDWIVKEMVGDTE